MSSLPSFAFWSSLLLLAAQLSAALILPEQVWGLHHMAFMPAPFTAILLPLVLLLLVLARYGPATWIETGYACVWQLPKPALFGVIPLVALVFFYLFRVRHLLLGDAALIPSLKAHPPAFLWPGENNAWFHFVLYRLLSPWVAEPWPVFAASSCLAGALFVFVALLFANAVGTHAQGKFFALMLLVGSGALQLFFGYVEHYALMTLFLVLTLYLLVLWRGKRKAYLLGATASCSIAFTLHPLASFMAPTLILAAGVQLWQWQQPARLRLAALGLLGAAGLLATLYWVLGQTDAHPLLIGPNPDTAPGYTLFSAAHLKDAVNEYLLLAPLHGPLLLFLLWNLRRLLGWRDPVLGCLALCLVSAWGTSFLIDPLLGSLDWDLLSVYAFPLAALTAYVAGRYPGERTPLVRSALCMAFASLLHVLPWIGVNTSPRRAGQMAEVMVAQDPHHRGYRNSMLGVKLQEMGLTEAAIRQYERAIAFDSTDYLAYNNLAWCLLALEQPGGRESAMAMFARFIETAPDSLDTRTAQGITALHAGRLEEGISLLAAFLLTYPPEVFEQKDFFGQARDFAESFAYYLAEGRHRQVLRAAVLFSKGETGQSLALARELVNRDPDDPMASDLLAGMSKRLQGQVGNR